MYLPEDPTIPRPDQYGDLSKADLLLVCEFWQFGALHWLRREKPDEFRQVFDNRVAWHDPAVQSMRALIIEGEAESARSAYFFSEFKFANLTKIIVWACDDFGVDPKPVYEFFEHRDADLEKAIRAVKHLEWCLGRKLAEDSTAHPEAEDAEHDISQGEQPARTDDAGTDPNKDGSGQRPAVDLDSQACAHHIAHTEWTMKLLAEKLGCSRPHLYRLPMLTNLRELLKTGKFNLPAGTKYADGSVEAFKSNPDVRTCPACREEHKFTCPNCDEDDRHCPVCHISLKHRGDVTD